MGRALWSFWAMTAVAGAAEVARAWPSQAPGGGFAGALALQVAATTGLWTLVLALALAGMAAALGRLWPAAPGGRAIPTAALLAPPALFVCLTLGQWIHAWSARAFARQDLAGAAVPALQLVAFAATLLVFALVHRLVARQLARLGANARLAAVAVGALAFAALHVARFPALTRDARVPLALQVAAAVVIGIAARRLPTRWLRGRRAWIGAGASLAALIALCVTMLYGGRIAPLSYPVAASALQARGLIAARVARWTTGVGDADGDGFSRFFGGSDCDDGNAAINPLAKDVPGNGIDEDCFEGDLSAAAVDADRAERLARRRPAKQRVRNVLMVSIDTVRADAVGFGGAEHPSTPALDRLAARGTVFRRAYTPAPMTRRAFPSLLSGRYPSNIHWLDQQTKYIYTVSHDDDVYMAEVMRDHAITTASILAFSYARLGHFNQGFMIDKTHPASRFKKETNADVVVDDAIGLLRKWYAPQGEPPAAPKRFFLWVHFYEAHYPYERHKGIDFGKSDRQRYLGEIRWVDDQLARLFAELEALGAADDTAIVFFSDHGEEFGDHGDKWHGDLYPEDVHVPMFVYVPGGQPRQLDVPVSLVDIAPTVIELLGLPIPPEYDGDSLLAWTEGEPPPDDRAVLVELIPDIKVDRRQVALIEPRWHYIVDFQHDTRELYDLQHDPTAQRNAWLEFPAEASRLEARLRRLLALRIGPLRITTAADDARRD